MILVRTSVYMAWGLQRPSGTGVGPKALLSSLALGKRTGISPNFEFHKFDIELQEKGLYLL